MEKKKRIHPGYEEWENAKKAGIEIRQIFGKYQYFYANDSDKISLISLPNYLLVGKVLWEAYSIEGDLIPDPERFKTKKEAEDRIKRLLINLK